MRKWLSNIFFSFPVQLLVLHLRSNLLLIAWWGLLALFITGSLADKYGLKYLFLSPEYFGEVGFWSFFFLGVGFAAMTMSWNLTVYLTSAHHFPFLATLAHPFSKFCLNNFIIPAAFTALLLYYHVVFSYRFEGASAQEIFLDALGFLFGMSTLLLFIFIYFYYTNKDIVRMLPKIGQQAMVPMANMPVQMPSNRRGWRVDTYITESLRIRLVRSVEHYDFSVLLRVFKQNHINALIVQILSLIVLVVLGILIDNPFFRIPAGASIFLLGSVIIALTGAISYWFRQWRLTVLLLLFVAVNFITRYEGLNHHSHAYGLDYEAAPAEYSVNSLKEICSVENVVADTANTINILNNWADKVTDENGEKPKMVLLAVSGGGLKSAVWSMYVLQQLDSLTNQAFFEHTQLITGASGGIIGTAYYRELILQQKAGETVDLYGEASLEKVGMDLLNPISFTIVTNDLFMPWIKFEYGGYRYVKDRGYAMERQFNENTDSLLQKTTADYRKVEYEAEVPMMFVTPAIVNDGRRMIISPHGVSYMMAPPIATRQPDAVEIDAVDFGRLFAEQNGENLGFLSALRMNATFPYILPNVYLPTDPKIEVMDAGFRDDFGLHSALRFAHVFQDWIKENTSGVVLVQVRAFDRDEEVPTSENQGVIESIFNPIGIAGQIISLQNYEQDNNLGFIYDILGEDMFDVVRLTYLPTEENLEATISFHLTKSEYQDILQAIHKEDNQESLEKLQAILGD